MDCLLCSTSNSPKLGSCHTRNRHRGSMFVVPGLSQSPWAWVDPSCRRAASSSLPSAVSHQLGGGKTHNLGCPWLGSCSPTGGSMVCSASSRDEARMNFVESVKSEKKLQSTRLNSDIREKVTRAIEASGNRVTVGDVAGRAGVSLFQAEEALKALAADSEGTLEVSEDGEVVYLFSSGFRNAILAKSIVMRWEPAFLKAQQIAGSIARSAFGLGFVMTVISVWVAVIAISSASSDNRDNRNSSSGGMSYMAFDLLDAFRWWYYFSQPAPVQKPGELGFMQAVYSVVFGDGDPNKSFEEQRWNVVGKYIQSRGGVVVGEELAPYLDPPKSSDSYDEDSGLFPDEGYMMPVLVRFGGEPMVDANGNLLYVFPKFQQSATKRLAPSPSQAYVQEKSWKLTAAKKTQQFLVAALAVANVVGVQILQNFVSTTPELAQLAPGLLALQIYAWSFVIIPLTRLFMNHIRNGKIDERNQAREQAAALLNFPSKALKQKLDSARLESKRKILTNKDMVFSSKNETREYEAQEFDRRLSELGSENF